MQHCGIYSARCASRIHGWHRLSGRAHNGRFVSFGWRFIHPHTNFCSACYTGCKLKYAWCLHYGGDSASSKSKGDVIIMKKRLISFLLALSMMLSLVPAGAVAAEVQNLVSARKPSTARRLPAGVWNRA